MCNSYIFLKEKIVNNRCKINILLQDKPRALCVLLLESGKNMSHQFNSNFYYVSRIFVINNQRDQLEHILSHENNSVYRWTTTMPTKTTQTATTTTPWYKTTTNILLSYKMWFVYPYLVFPTNGIYVLFPFHLDDVFTKWKPSGMFLPRIVTTFPIT